LFVNRNLLHVDVAGQVCRPSLTHVIRGDQAVDALTSFNNQLFVTRHHSPIAVYDTTTFAWRRSITVSGAGSYMNGLARCRTGDCLYVSDSFKDKDKVHKLNLSPTPGSNSAITATSWSVGTNPRGLSVNRQHNLWIALEGSRKIVEYTPSGSLIREIAGSNKMWHAVDYVVNGTFVVSRDGPVHGVGLMSFDGRVIRSYGSTTRGSGPGQMNTPRSLAVDRKGFVLVADEHNDRILALNPTLSDARRLPLPTDANGQPLNKPCGLWLDESKGRLYVGEHGRPYRVLVYDNVFCVGTLFIT
jgi:DNA-binding beta-propeller fold protein YncE